MSGDAAPLLFLSDLGVLDVASRRQFEPEAFLAHLLRERPDATRFRLLRCAEERLAGLELRAAGEKAELREDFARELAARLDGLEAEELGFADLLALMAAEWPTLLPRLSVHRLLSNGESEVLNAAAFGFSFMVKARDELHTHSFVQVLAADVPLANSAFLCLQRIARNANKSLVLARVPALVAWGGGLVELASVALPQTLQIASAAQLDKLLSAVDVFLVEAR